jgi:uncharacterized protein YdaU (DUF1376 family)
MPLVIGDYLKDTSRLNAQQHGAYLLIIMDYWVNGPPPDDDAQLAKIAACDPQEWKRVRAKIARYFRIEDGVWRHKRIEQELDRWTTKKKGYVSRSSKGGQAKAAKYGHGSAKGSASSSAYSTPQAVLNECQNSAPQPASQEVEGLPSSTLLGRFQNQDFRQSAIERSDPGFVVSYLDQCRWVDLPSPHIVAPHGMARDALRKRLRSLLVERNIAVIAEGEELAA